MRHFGLLILLLCSCIVIAEQPNWYSESQRAANFPKGQYFTGIAHGEVRANEDDGSAMERMKAAARVDVLSTISIHVQNETNSHLRDESFESVNAWSEEISETFDSRTQTKVNMENIPGLQAEAWKNPNSNEVIAFAYIKKNTLCRQMEKQITAGLIRIETILENTEQLITNGQKLQARESLHKAMPLFDEVEQAQRILIAVNLYADEEDLQLNNSKQLAKHYINLSSALQNSINICFIFTAEIFDKTYCPLKDEVVRELSKKGCTFVDNAAKADWILTLKVRAEQEDWRNNAKEDFVTIDVSGTIYNVKRQSSHEIYERERDSAFKDNGGYKLAADKILKRGNLANAIAKDIIDLLKSE